MSIEYAKAPTEPGFYWAQTQNGKWELVLCNPEDNIGHYAPDEFCAGHPRVGISHMGWDIDTTRHTYVKFVPANLVDPDGKAYTNI